jgi:hypothetical protein
VGVLPIELRVLVGLVRYGMMEDYMEYIYCSVEVVGGIL